MKANRSSLILVAIVLTAFVLGCDGASHISGHVYDSNDKPVNNAKILFEDAASEKSDHPEYYQYRTETNGEGRFNAGIMHAPFDIKLRLTVTKEGFRTYVTEFYSSDAHKMVDDKHELSIVLEKETQ